MPRSSPRGRSARRAPPAPSGADLRGLPEAVRDLRPLESERGDRTQSSLESPDALVGDVGG